MIVAVTLQPPVVRITGLPTTTTTSTHLDHFHFDHDVHDHLHDVPGHLDLVNHDSTSTSTTTSTSDVHDHDQLQLPPSGSTSVLPPTRAVSVVLVVANAGNVPISGIWASGIGRTRNPRPARHPKPGRSDQLDELVRIGRLAPGASVEVTLPPLAVDAGRHLHPLGVGRHRARFPDNP